MRSKKSNFLRVTLISGAFLLKLITGCSPEKAELSRLPMNWESVDTLNTKLPDGIQLYAGRNESMPLRAWYVSIDEKRADILTRVVVSDDRTDNRETVSSFARDLGALVVVNGGYFTMHQNPARHVGLLMADSVIVKPAADYVMRESVRYEIARATFGFSGEDELDISWTTTRNDTVFSWPAPPQNQPGKPAPHLDYTGAQVWKVRDAIGAGPALIIDGKIQITSDEEVFFGTSIPNTHPRTAIGYTDDGTLILMVVDGRQAESRGVTLEELATLMYDLGAVEAMNLDGGGSSTLVVNNTLVNRPTGGTVEREVMSAIATFVVPR